MKLLDRITGWIRDNKVASTSAVLLIVVAAAMVACAGFDLRDYMKVSVPTSVQKAQSVPPVVRLSDAETLYQSFVHRTKVEAENRRGEFELWAGEQEAAAARLAKAISGAESRVQFIGSLVDLGISSVAESSGATFPGGALILSGLAGLLGLSVDRPGTASKVAKEKERSFNAGLERGRTAGAA